MLTVTEKQESERQHAELTATRDHNATELRRIFGQLDRNNSGTLDSYELEMFSQDPGYVKDLVALSGVQRGDVREIFEILGSNTPGGIISLDTFVQGLQNLGDPVNEQS